MSISYKGVDRNREIRCVEKQVGWDIVHFFSGEPEVFKVSIPNGYKRQRVIL